MIEDLKVQLDPLEVFGVEDKHIDVGLSLDEWFLEPWDQEMSPLAQRLFPCSVELIKDDIALPLVTQGFDTQGFHNSTITFPKP